MSSWREIGEHLGYPECCISFFEEAAPKIIAERKHVYTVHDLSHMPWAGTGFLPCPSCRENGADTEFDTYVAERIAPNRKHKHPFPEYEQ